MAGTNDIVGDLNELLRDELAAIETYRHAIDRNRKAHGQDARFQKLTDMLHDHEEAAARLRDLVQRMGGTAVRGAGTWGTWANTVLGAASLLGDKAALRALREGEESGVKDYRAALQEATAVTTPEILDVCAWNLSREEEHVRQLDRLIAFA
jgi:bacterioferritin (cytochrome b1)